MCSVGEFFSESSLGVPREMDHRYVPNVISSAIVNTPPAEAVSNILSKRNKVHHLDSQCDETQVPVFEYDVNGKKLNNPCLLPRRNWCSINHSPQTGALDVKINVELDQSRDDGRTKPYPYTIPRLDLVTHFDRFTQQGFNSHQQPQSFQPVAQSSPQKFEVNEYGRTDTGFINDQHYSAEQYQSPQQFSAQQVQGNDYSRTGYAHDQYHSAERYQTPQYSSEFVADPNQSYGAQYGQVPESSYHTASHLRPNQYQPTNQDAGQFDHYNNGTQQQQRPY